MRSVTGYESNVDIETVSMDDGKIEIPDVEPPKDIVDVDLIFKTGNDQQLSRSKRLVSLMC